MQLSLIVLFAGAGAACVQAQTRPAITGISHIAVYSTDAAATQHFYADELGGKKMPDPESPQGTCYYFSSIQYVEVLPVPAGQGISRLAHIGYVTVDAEGLRTYVAAHGFASATEVKTGTDGSKWFSVPDPEGNVVEFVQPADPKAAPMPGVMSSRMIHVGFMVRSRAAEDKFYRDLLGFRPYWFGAMHPEKLDWVSEQTPEGHDWLEYMLVGDGSDTPLDHVDARELGVLNHFSLGVANMEQAFTRLFAEDRLSPRHDGPQVGRDGKWQANLYDPDQVRVEFMEFQPSAKPCCSSFTADSPLN